MPPLSVYEAEFHLPRLIARATAVEDDDIARTGKPLVKLVPFDAAPLTVVFGT